MTDEKFVFLEDSKNKKRTARSARNKVGKGGKKVRFPSDYMTKKELENMNSDVKSYNLTQPMKWADFKAMPDDLHKAYLLRIRNLYAAPASQIAEMFGVNRQTVINEQTRLGIPSLPKGVRANPEFANFAKFGTPVNSGFTKVEISRLEDLVSPEVKAKLAQYEKEHPPAVIAKVESAMPIDTPIGASNSCQESIPHNRLSAKDYGNLNYVSGCVAALRAIYATDTNFHFYDGALASIGQILDNTEVYV